MKHIKVVASTQKIVKPKSCLLVTLDGQRLPTLPTLYAFLKEALMLPNYFGKNLDALFDVLTDLTWIPQQSIILVITHFGALLEKENQDNKEAFIQTLEDAVGELKAQPTAEKKLKIFVIA